MTELLFITNSISTVREITHDGKPYLIAPVVMIREGVLNGYLLLAEEFGKYVESWNGRPCPLGHPQRNGEYISANSPDVWAMEVPGHLWNAATDGNRLTAEIWIDLDRAEKIGERAMTVVSSLRANEPTEVSTGYFADVEDSAGNYKGKPYSGIHRNIRSDHLALLPGEIGACSWEDGCGTPRVNKRGTMKVNEMELDDRVELVRMAFWRDVDRLTNEYDAPDLGIIAVFDATVIAKDWRNKAHFAYPYSFTVDGEVAFGTPTAVEVVYRDKDGGAEVVVANTNVSTIPERGMFGRFMQWVKQGEVKGVVVNRQEEKDVKKCDLVAVLAANKRVQFAREKLETWSEEDLLSLLGSLATNEEVAGVATDTVVAPMTVELPASLTKFAELLDKVGVDAFGQALQSITANADSEKADLVADLVANEQCQFDEAELKAMSTGSLQKLAGSLQVRDYSGAGGVMRNSSREQEHVMEMPKLEWAVAKGDK